MKKTLINLDASGVSPWHHRVELADGCLVIYWRTTSGTDRVRCFTQEETLNLLNFLYDRKIEILKD